MSLRDYLSDRDAIEAEPLLRNAGIERAADLLQLDANDLAALGMPVELQYKLFGTYTQEHEVEADEFAGPEIPKVIKRRGPAASGELEGFLEKAGLAEAVPLLVELGIERLGDLRQLDADDITHLGLPDHLANGLVIALGMDS